MTARHAALLVLLLAATAAASADEVVKTHEDPTFDGTVAKILVVGVHSDGNVRTMFENGMARALREAGTVAEPSIGRMGSAQELTADTLVAAAARADADAVLVVRAVDAEAQTPLRRLLSWSTFVRTPPTKTRFRSRRRIRRACEPISISSRAKQASGAPNPRYSRSTTSSVSSTASQLR